MLPPSDSEEDSDASGSEEEQAEVPKVVMIQVGCWCRSGKGAGGRASAAAPAYFPACVPVPVVSAAGTATDCCSKLAEHSQAYAAVALLSPWCRTPTRARCQQTQRRVSG